MRWTLSGKGPRRSTFWARARSYALTRVVSKTNRTLKLMYFIHFTECILELNKKKMKIDTQQIESIIIKQEWRVSHCKRCSTVLQLTHIPKFSLSLASGGKTVRMTSREGLGSFTALFLTFKIPTECKK